MIVMIKILTMVVALVFVHVQAFAYCAVPAFWGPASAGQIKVCSDQSCNPSGGSGYVSCNYYSEASMNNECPAAPEGATTTCTDSSGEAWPSPPPPPDTIQSFAVKNDDGTYSYYTVAFNADGSVDEESWNAAQDNPKPIPFDANGNWQGPLYDPKTQTYSNATMYVNESGGVSVGTSPYAENAHPKTDQGAELSMEIVSATADDPHDVTDSTKPDTISTVQTVTTADATHTVTTTETLNPDGSKTITNVYSSVPTNGGPTVTRTETQTLNTPNINVELTPVVTAVNNSKDAIVAKTEEVNQSIKDLKTGIKSELTAETEFSADEIAGQADFSADEKINQIGSTVTADIDSITNNFSPSNFPASKSISDKVRDLFPSPVAASDVCYSVNYRGTTHLFCIKAQTFERIRLMLSFLFAIWTLATVYAAIFEQPLVK